MKKQTLILVFTAALSVIALAAEHAPHDLVAVTSVNPRIRLDIRYATTNNFTGRQVYPSAKAYLRKTTALKLDNVQKKLENRKLGLKVYDAYRPLSVQKIFWEIVPDERYVADPKKGSRHNRGSAVDVTLVELDSGRELEMPSGYDDFTERAAYAFTNLPPAAVSNRALLRALMTECGFIPLETEWWHFDDAGWTICPVMDIPLENLPY
ncbi:MAG: M15 family metallopeptidase [Kiritimatiellae bacterium]|nr:M15 family metallopeptidase [Kiritimatiellia bacterium]